MDSIVKIIIVILLALLLMLQARLILGDGSIPTLMSLKKQVQLKGEEVEKLKERNRLLEAEISDLKQHMGAIEERARTELGMVREGETFYQIAQ